MSSGKEIKTHTLWIVLAVSLLTHFVYASLDHDHYGVDTPTYLIPADNLLHGNGYTNWLHQPELRRTPGYPVLLAIFKIAPLKLEYLVAAQHIFCVLLAVAVALFALKITGSRVLSLTTTVVLSLDFATLRIANMLLTEIAATVLITCTAWFVYRAMTHEAGRTFSLVTAGLLGGCSVLVRPAGIFYFLPLSFCLFIALRRRTLLPAVLLTASFLLLPVLWAVRNYTVANYFGISTISAENVLYYRAAGAVAIQQPGNYLANVVRVRNSLIDETCPDLVALYRRSCSDITEAERASYATQKGTNLILKNKMGYFRSTLLALAYMVFGGGAEALSQISHINPILAERMVLLFTVPEAFLALIGCWYWYRRDRNLCYLLVLSIAYFLIISAGAEAYSRFRVPVMPMYTLLIGGGVAEIVQLINRKKPNLL